MTPDIIAIMGVGVAIVAIVLTAMHRMESRLNNRIETLESNTKKDIADSEARTRAEIAALEARTSVKFEEVREQFVEVNEQFRQMQARTDAGFADVNEQLRTTNDRMTSVERQQARLGGLLDGLREALFQRVQQ